MAHIEDEDRTDDEDPRTARIVRRMRIFVGVSTAIMFVGFVLVMSVIVWRLVKRDEVPALASPPVSAPTSGQELSGTVTLPAGARIVGTTSDGQRLFITIEAADGAQSIQVFDVATLTYRGRIETSFAP
ncbi:DUF6476 family protein [Terrihabitans sp. B22-R8]|uniref:DUF6476 family protein n=1 Tax=Terrihabitans sp. B22-R8 TaxID=3425128 RepID=UPI00403D21A1